MGEFEAPTLVGVYVRLDPLMSDDAEGLRRAADLADFKYFLDLQPSSLGAADFQEYVSRLLREPATCPMAVRRIASGDLIGSTSFMAIDPANRGLEIGMSWLNQRYRGTDANPEMKLLMLRHAFESWSAVRVQLKTDARNILSQRAISKLGARQEGVLRNHRILPDGFIRDTVMYSVTDAEWPTIMRQLEARVEAAGRHLQ